MDFIYTRAGSLGEVLELKAEHKEGAAFLAGGTDLLVDIRNRALASELQVIIDISCLDEIRYVRREGEEIAIGAATTIAEIQKSPIVQEDAAILFQSCEKFANPLIKNLATLGGNLMNASPSADMAPPLLALEASAVLKSVAGERAILLEELFSDVKKTKAGKDELLAGVRFKKAQGKSCEFLKLGQRNGTAISVASLALMFSAGGGVIESGARLALGSVAPVPFRARKTEAALQGMRPSLEEIERAGDILKREVSPISDVRGSMEYRRELSARLLIMAFYNLGFIHGQKRASSEE